MPFPLGAERPAFVAVHHAAHAVADDASAAGKALFAIRFSYRKPSGEAGTGALVERALLASAAEPRKSAQNTGGNDARIDAGLAAALPQGDRPRRDPAWRPGGHLTLGRGTDPPNELREVRDARQARRQTARRRRLAHRRPGRDACLEHLAASRSLVRPARHRRRSTTPSIRGSFPIRSPGSSTTPKTGCCSSI